LNEPKTIKDCGVEEGKFLAAVDELADKAMEDQCTNANPRYPLVSELAELYKQAYYGDSAIVK
jgi:acetaldehyde dehydrogenase/alcohol dehydrogenase